MTKGNITLMWRHLNAYEFTKDVVMVPLHLGRALGCNVRILCGWDSDLDEEVARHTDDSLSFIRWNLGYSPRSRMPQNVKWLLKNARTTSVLMCFHFRPETIINVLTYKLLNRKGKTYVKLDTIAGDEFNKKGLKGRIYKWAAKKVDVFSCETKASMENILRAFPEIKDKLLLLPNPVDEAVCKSSAPKENMILTVGRLYTNQKNTEMLLEALKQTDLKDWKCILAGPGAEKEEQGNIIFAGDQRDRAALADLYARAKVFVLTSRWESYGIVLAEAAACGCFLVTTPVGAAPDIVEQCGGIIVAQEDSEALAQVLSEIIDGKIELDEKPHRDAIMKNYEDSISAVSRILRF